MRDGIFKSAPVPNSWRKVGSRASREADHGLRLTEAMEEAATKDTLQLRKLIQGFLPQDDNPLLIDDRYRLGSLIQTFEPLSQLERDFRNTLQMAYSQSEANNFNDAVQSALKHALKNHIDAMVAEFKGHGIKRCGDDFRSFFKGAQALEKAAASVDTSKIALSIINPINEDHNPAKAKKFDWDENLLG